MWDTVAKYLWGYYSEQERRYVSWCEPEWKIRAVKGVQGVEWLTGQPIKYIPIVSGQVSYFHELLGLLRNCGYVDEQNLVAFPYDWRQDPTGALV